MLLSRLLEKVIRIGTLKVIDEHKTAEKQDL